MKTFTDLKRRLLADPQTRAEYEALADEFEMARELIATHSRAGLSQDKVARRAGKTHAAG